MHAAVFALLVTLSGALLDASQAPPPPPQTAAPAQTAPPARQAEAPPKPAAPENYTYDPAGRRDPFLNLLGTGTEARQVSKKGEGPSGMTVAEVSVRGVMQSRSGLIAMVQGPDNKTYIVHPGDKLLDGAIKSITPQGLIIEQAVNDPLSVVKQREVRKLLRGLEDTK
jgi:Tfp pilus assembly protein PilP